MRLRDFIICSISIILAVVLFITAGLQLDYINSQRQEMKLISNEPLKNAPPSLAFATVAMGAFRGLVVDILWMRADALKNKGQFFDAKQLAEWITTLQPRFASVWDFQAWNMAYNISVAIPANQPEERWRWVKNGYELLRDQGIVLNPKSILLYKSLAWIFQHKIAGYIDDTHEYYKLQLALAMEPLLGNADNNYFDALTKAPADFYQIANDANITPLIQALKAADPAFADDDSFVSNYLSLRQNPSMFAPKAFKVINDFRNTKTLDQFDIFAKAYQLRNVWKLDPVLMNKLNQLYGPTDYEDPNKHLPLDWRNPDCHAIYWAVKGLEMAQKNDFSLDETNTDRIVVHSLQNLFRNGKIFIYSPPPSTVSISVSFGGSQPPEPRKDIYLRPDLRMFEPYNKSILAVLEKYKPDKSAYGSLQTGHKNMLRNAVLSFYQAGLLRQAQRLYDELQQLYPDEEFTVPLAVFARERLREEMKSLGINDVKEMVQLLLQESYFRYAMRDDDEAFGREKIVQEAYEYYQARMASEERVKLPDLKLLRYLALREFIDSPQYPLELRQSLITRIKIERPDLAEKLKQEEKKLFKLSEQQENTNQQPEN
jgi:hypothetical protein